MTNNQKVHICDIDKCMGCGLCEAVCSSSAIEMKIVEGFYRPIINDNCIGCLACQKNCPANNHFNIKNDLKNIYRKECYAAWDKDSKMHFLSSSGGLASLLSKAIIENGGFVVSAQFNYLNQCVEHVLIDKMEELDRNRGSKYVNSNKSGVYEKVYSRIIEKKCTSLFIGVPCEVYAMKQFLKMKKCQDSMIYVDLLCHGGASPLCFNQHINRISRGKRIDDVHFRGGENDCKLVIYSNDSIIYSDYQYADLYFNLFMEHVLYQPACYNCIFAGIDRCGDITLGDFWGLDETIYNKSKEMGCNMVLINTDTGNELFDSISGKVEYYKRPIEEAVKGNTTLSEATLYGKGYDEFWDVVKRSGFHKAAKKVYRLSFLKRYVISRIRIVLRKKRGLKCGKDNAK